jgi:hypothetical protein
MDGLRSSRFSWSPWSAERFGSSSIQASASANFFCAPLTPAFDLNHLDLPDLPDLPFAEGRIQVIRRSAIAYAVCLS